MTPLTRRRAALVLSLSLVVLAGCSGDEPRRDATPRPSLVPDSSLPPLVPTSPLPSASPVSAAPSTTPTASPRPVSTGAPTIIAAPPRQGQPRPSSAAPKPAPKPSSAAPKPAPKPSSAAPKPSSAAPKPAPKPSSAAPKPSSPAPKPSSGARYVAPKPIQGVLEDCLRTAPNKYRVRWYGTTRDGQNWTTVDRDGGSSYRSGSNAHYVANWTVSGDGKLIVEAFIGVRDTTTGEEHLYRFPDEGILYINTDTDCHD